MSGVRIIMAQAERKEDTFPWLEEYEKGIIEMLREELERRKITVTRSSRIQILWMWYESQILGHIDIEDGIARLEFRHKRYNFSMANPEFPDDLIIKTHDLYVDYKHLKNQM